MPQFQMLVLPALTSTPKPPLLARCLYPSLSIVQSAVVSVVALGLFAQASRSDDAYVCDGGRLFYAKPATLEKFQAANVDPCNGRALDPTKSHAIQTPARTSPPAPRPSSEPMTPGIIKPPTGPSLGPPRFRNAAEQVGPGMNGTATNQSASSFGRRSQPTTAVSAQPLERSDASPTPIKTKATAPADESYFRAVPILNAAPGSPAVYRHNR